MATAGDGRITPCNSGGAGEKSRKRSLLPDLNAEPENDQEAGKNNSSGVSELSTHQVGNCASISAVSGISELEQILKQKTFTRSETQRLISLLHSRTCDNAVVERDGAKPPLSRIESSTSGSLKKHKHGDQKDNFHTAVVLSRVLEEEIDSSAELVNVYKGSTISFGLPTTSMASLQYPTTMENLPDELLLNIFIRLLAKQLAQMRSVSKSWNALLSQSSFVKSHLHRFIDNSDRILLAFYERSLQFDFKLFTTHSRRSPHLELTDFIKLPVDAKFKDTTSIDVIGSANGLICCFLGHGSDIHIWNPSLSAILTLPPNSMLTNGEEAKCYFRFGFDPKTDDYKIVKLTGLTGPPLYDVDCWLQVEIYSMRKGSWELITERVPSHITDITEGDYISADGHDGRIHWFGYIKKEVVLQTIVAFDLGSETFRELPLPDSTLDYTDGRLNGLGVLAEKLCVMSYVRAAGTCEVWVMEEYGVSESWVKRHVFSQFVCGTYPLGFTSHNEFLIEDNGYLVLYDPISNYKLATFEKYHYPYVCQLIIVEYVDSLVWIAPAHREMVDDAGRN